MLAAQLLLLALLFFAALAAECQSARHNPALLAVAFWGCVASLYAMLGVVIASLL